MERQLMSIAELRRMVFYEEKDLLIGSVMNGNNSASKHNVPPQFETTLSEKSVEDEEAIDQDDRAVKRFRMGDFVDTVKNAAEGVKTHSSSVASWVRNSVSPTLRNMLPASPDAPLSVPTLEPPDNPTPAETPWTKHRVEERVVDTYEVETFVAPSTVSEWRQVSKPDSLRVDRALSVSKIGRRQVCMGLLPRDAPKTNGHSLGTPTGTPCPAAKTCPPPRLGRSLNLRPHAATSGISIPGSCGAGSSTYTSMYEKTFPIRVVQSPTNAGAARTHRTRPRCTAQESVREEEKEVYRQLLAVVSGGHSSLLQDGCPHTSLHSHRDFSSFLSVSRRLLRCPSPTLSVQGGSSSCPPSPPVGFSQPSSTLPSPGGASSGAEPWSPAASDGQSSPPGPDRPDAAPSPATLQDTSSQDTQVSAQDGDSVIFVKEKQGKRPDGSSVPCFQAELWIKELTSLYDSRARERRRLIEEQEALASRLLQQRLSAEGSVSMPAVELQLRVPLEREVPLAPVTQEPKHPADEPEYPEITEAMEAEVSRALRGGSQDEVLSQGFRLTITRKDLQTLSHLNWLNDEVINFYMNLLVERSKRPGLPSVHTFNTFFFPKLKSSGYSAVRRWTKKTDIFSVDIILVPVHLGVHWCLSVVDLRKKRVTYFDSMGGSNDEACRILLNYLKQESKDKKGKELDTSDWTLQSKKRNEIPQQMNGSDCGMFTCKYAEYITKDRPITFTQKHMPYFRKRMVWEILHQKLL